MTPLKTPRTEKRYVGSQLVISCDACSRSDSTGVRCPECLRDETIGQFDPGSAIVEVRAERAGITVDRYPLTLHTERGAVYPKSPDGHTWGYSGSGPSQLALDVIWDLFERQPQPSLYHAFKALYIAPARTPGWSIRERDVRAFVASFEGDRWVEDWDALQRAAECQHADADVVTYEPEEDGMNEEQRFCRTCGESVTWLTRQQIVDAIVLAGYEAETYLSRSQSTRTRFVRGDRKLELGADFLHLTTPSQSQSKLISSMTKKILDGMIDDREKVDS